MNVPGFTAEASLYRTSRHYHIGRTAIHAEGTIQPAIRNPRCMEDCLDMCNSDPNLYEFNDCNEACACACSSGHYKGGCWQ